MGTATAVISRYLSEWEAVKSGVTCCKAVQSVGPPVRTANAVLQVDLRPLSQSRKTQDTPGQHEKGVATNPVSQRHCSTTTTPPSRRETTSSPIKRHVPEVATSPVPVLHIEQAMDTEPLPSVPALPPTSNPNPVQAARQKRVFSVATTLTSPSPTIPGGVALNRPNRLLLSTSTTRSQPCLRWCHFGRAVSP